MGEGGATPGDESVAAKDLNEQGTQVDLAGLDQWHPHYDLAFADAEHLPVTEADFLGSIHSCGKGEEVELGAAPYATCTDGLLMSDLNVENGTRSNSFCGADSDTNCWEDDSSTDSSNAGEVE